MSSHFRSARLTSARGSGEFGDLVELLAVSPVGAFDVAVELRRARREDKQLDSPVAASILELGHELGAPVYLNCLNWEGHALEDRIQEAGRRVSGGAAMCVQYLPAAKYIAGGEVFEAEASEELNMNSVDLNDVIGGAAR